MCSWWHADILCQLLGYLCSNSQFDQIKFLLIVAQLLDLKTQALDFVVEFPQTNLEVPVYMEIPTDMNLEGEGKQSSRYLLKINKSLYSLKQGNLNWYIKLKTALLIRGFVESISDQ